MLIIPSIETVIIQPPRTGSESVAVAVKARYADALHPFKHMELDGIPDEYLGYKKVGIFRAPDERLWSWYKKLEAAMSKHNVALPPFESWLSTSDSTVTKSAPFRQTIYDVPETVKSLMYYYASRIGRDSTIDLYAFNDLPAFFASFDLDPVHINETVESAVPQSPELEAHLKLYFAWDLSRVEQYA